MIILYVPFSRDKSGDLESNVNIWKVNHLLNSNEPINIIYQGDDFDFDTNSCIDTKDGMQSHTTVSEIEETSYEVYICAHGISDNLMMVVANNAYLAQAEIMDIQTVAEHFNNDFLPIAHRISAIHFYCCGDKNKNKQIAFTFREGLLRAEMPIYSYSGKIYAPDRNGNLWSVSSTGFVPVEDTSTRLYMTDVIKEEPVRTSIKSTFSVRSLEKSLEGRRNYFFTQNKSDKTSQITYCRSLALDTIDLETDLGM